MYLQLAKMSLTSKKVEDVQARFAPNQVTMELKDEEKTLSAAPRSVDVQDIQFPTNSLGKKQTKADKCAL